MILLMLLNIAHAGGHHVVRPGETLESISIQEGLAGQAEELRRLNGIAPTAQAPVGTVLDLPDRPGEAESIALLRLLYGQVELTPEGSAPVQATQDDVGAELSVGTRVCTGPGSFATVKLAIDPNNGHHDDVNLMPDTCVVLDKVTSLPGARSSLLTVDGGSISVKAAGSKMTSGRVTVRTSDAVATSKQGGHRVHVEDGATRTEALHHPLVLTGGGKELVLNAGFGSRVKRGQGPSSPVPLLVPGAPLRPAPSAQLRVPDFEWTPVGGALGYVVEIAADTEFDEVVLSIEVGKVPWQPELLLLPYREEGMWWRISSFDRLGYIGLPSEPRHLEFPPGSRP